MIIGLKSQCAARILNEIVKKINETFTGSKHMLSQVPMIESIPLQIATMMSMIEYEIE